MWLLPFSLIGFQSYELLSGIVLITIAIVVSRSIIVLVRLFLFGLDHSAQVPWKEVLANGWRETDDTLTVSKAITTYSCNGRNVLFPQLIYFKWTEKVVVALLSLWLFLMNSNELELLLLGIKFLILFSNSHLTFFSLCRLFGHILAWFIFWGGTTLIHLGLNAAL